MIQAAASGGDPEEDPKAARAMTEFCRLYWEPSPPTSAGTDFNAPDAEDLTQEFLAKIPGQGGPGGNCQRKGQAPDLSLDPPQALLIDHRARPRH